MRFIGGKTSLLPEIAEQIASLGDVHTVIDLFSGSGAVSAFLKRQQYEVIGNDIMYFAYVLSRGTTGLDSAPVFPHSNLRIAHPIQYLNDLTLDGTGFSLDECFIYQNYTPHDDVKRMYFQPDNAIKIDLVRMTIERWRQQGRLNDDEYYYLLASLIAAVPYVSNIAGVYGAYLKHWDKRTYNPLTLKEPEVISGPQASFFNRDANELLKRDDVCGDLLYSDSPYNERQYMPNYHVLETIARYDRPEIHGVTGMRPYKDQRSEFCMKSRVEGAFRSMIENAKVKYVLISYNNEGLLSTEALAGICEEYAVPGTFRLTELDYRRYKSAKADKSGVKEQLYLFRKR